jgi:glycosyltransferase involved in cell wall biosynthesis
MERHHIQAVEDSGARYFGELEGLHLKRWWRSTGQLRRLRQLFRREKIDIVHSHFLGVNAWYAALTRFHPAVITVMGGDILGQDWQPGDDIRERWLTPFALRNADLVTCWSSKLTNVVRRYTPPTTPIAVIHEGVDVDRFQPGQESHDLRSELGLPEGAKVVLSPRLMRPLYNLDKIAMAATRVWDQVPNAVFVFAVLPEAKDFDYERQVRNILSADQANRVRFVDAIPHDRMADYYRLADVTISIPSSDGTPMSVLESLACETPVVVSDIENYDKDYIEADETVVAVDPQDVGSIASGLVRALTDTDAMAALAAEGRRRLGIKGSHEAQMLKMEELYYSLIPQ